MKREIPISKILAIALFLVTISIMPVNNAKAKNKDLTSNSLLAPIQNLADAISDLVKVIARATEQNLEEPAKMTLETTVPDYRVPSCLANHETWNSSYTFNSNAIWNPLTQPRGTSGVSSIDQYFDINGDGLIDHIYQVAMDSAFYGTNGLAAYYTGIDSCVMLNTGSGWEIAYRCKSIMDMDTYSPIYYGDCADMTP